MSLDQQRAKLGDVLESLTAGQLSRRINGQFSPVLGPPGTDGVKVLQGESQRVNLPMALGARGNAAVLSQFLSHGQRAANVRLDLGHIIGRGRRGVTQHLLQSVDTTDHWRGIDTVGRSRQEAALRHQPTAHGTLGRDLTQVVALHRGQSVMGCQLTVHEGVISIEEPLGRQVLIENLAEEHLRLRCHRRLQVVAEIHTEIFGHRHFTDVVPIEPAPDELIDEPLGTWILEHAIDLSVEHVRVGQASRFGMFKQDLIGLRRPQEVRQTRRQTVTVERPVPLLQIDERRRAKDRLETQLQCGQRVHASLKLRDHHPLDRLEFITTQRAAKSTCGEQTQTLSDRAPIQFIRLQVAIHQRVTGGRPLVDVRALDPDVVDAEFRAAVDLEQSVGFLIARFHVRERRDLGVLRCVAGNDTDQAFCCGGAVTEADLRLETLIDVRGPLEPRRLIAGQLGQSDGAFGRDAAGALDTAFTIYRSHLQHQRVAVAEVVQRLTIGMLAVDCSSLHADGVHTALSHAAVQRPEADVSATEVTPIHIGVGRVRDEAKAIDMKELGQLRLLLAIEIIRCLLGVLFRLGPWPETCGTRDRFLSGAKVMIQQHARRDQLTPVVVKTVYLYIRRKICGWVPSLDVQRQKVTDRLLILKPVEPPHDGVLTAGRQLGTSGGNPHRDRRDGLRLLARNGLLLLGRRHFTEVQLIDDLLPQLQLIKVGDLIGQPVETTIGFLRVRAVTVDAVGRKELRGQVGVGCSAEGEQHHAQRGKCHLVHAMSVP